MTRATPNILLSRRLGGSGVGISPRGAVLLPVERGKASGICTVDSCSCICRPCPSSHAHMPDWVAPVAIPGAAADGADLEGVVLAGGEAVDRHGARVGEEAAADPRVKSVRQRIRS